MCPLKTKELPDAFNVRAFSLVKCKNVLNALETGGCSYSGGNEQIKLLFALSFIILRPGFCQLSHL